MDKSEQIIYLTARICSATRRGKRLGYSAGLNGFIEHLRLRLAGYVGQIRQLQSKPDVRLVSAVLLHNVVIAEARERPHNAAVVGHFLGYIRVKLFDEGSNVVLVNKAHLQIQLGVLVLAVASKVFVPEATSYLEIALEAGDHEELLHLLRGLRQGVEAAWVQTAGDKEITGSFRGAFD